MAVKPTIAITMGDPFGNGPEITIKALNDPKIYENCNPLVVGDSSCMNDALLVAKRVSGIDLRLHPIQNVKDAAFHYGTIDLIDLNLVKAEQLPHHDKKWGANTFWHKCLRFGRRGCFSICR